MPWKEELLMDQKTQFISEYLRDSLSFTELCLRYHISRKTGYKWIARYQALGPVGLFDRSRRPHSFPVQTPDCLRRAIIEVRLRHPIWGAKKLLKLPERKDPQTNWPSGWTVCEILKRHGLVRQKTQRRKTGHPILDAFSRRCIGWALEHHLQAELAVAALRMAITSTVVKPGLVHHSDRGVQYASHEYTGLLEEHGIKISMSRRGNAYDNARAERFMRTLKYEQVYMFEYEDMTEARERISHILEEVYNRKRLHSALSYMPPAEFEQSFLSANTP
jgi:transposase InsO family protein